MKTETKETIVNIQDDKNHAINWLKSEYPRGVDLIYIDYRDNLSAEQLQEVIKNGYMEDESWLWDSQYDTINEIIANYRKENDIDTIEQEVIDEMRDWLTENDTSTPTKDLLKNTRNHLFYFETEDEFFVNPDEEDTKKNDEVIKKYAKTEEQEKEIHSTFNESFYNANISFYFYADALELYKAIHESKEKYIIIDGAYLSTITRGNGSNWLGDKAVFKIAVEREELIKNMYSDEAKGNGYGWRDIAGQSRYDEATLYSLDTPKEDTLIVEPETSEEQKRETRLQENWDKTKTCTRGDMNWNRHKGQKTYSNNYPCGSTCETCGTFWID